MANNIFRCRSLSLCILMWVVSGPLFAQPSKPWAAIGRDATPAEVTAWDIDVRGDFKGLPPGAGTVSKGEAVWEDKCASCHGSFGESNEVFTPIVGGTTDADIKNGRVAALADHSSPGRTTLMKLSKISTLWDYINRAMPWTTPKSLTTEEVYAVVAYILNMGGIVPADFTLSDKNIAQVQARLPNRNGLAVYEDLWKVNGKGDVKNVACMRNCATEIKITSFLPDFARNAHGNLAEQNRVVGAIRGADTTVPSSSASPKPGSSVAALAKPTAATTANPPSARADAAQKFAAAIGALKANGCLACHGLKNRIVGPGFKDIAARYKSESAPDNENYLAGKIKKGGSGIWGAIPMPPQSTIEDLDAKNIAQWIAAGAP